MPLISVQKVPVARRTRPATPRCRGGASSMLRLAQSGAPRLPSTLDLAGWMSQAAVALMPVTGPHFDVAPHDGSASGP